MKHQKIAAKQLEQKAYQMRKEILEMIVAARGTHIGSAFSIIDILVYLYDQVLSINPKNPKEVLRDKFVLSKGHGCAALYVVLANYGFYSKTVLQSYCTEGGILGGHPDSTRVPGIETSTGSLGHGFPVSVGFALADKINNFNAADVVIALHVHNVICRIRIDHDSTTGYFWYTNMRELDCYRI